jgi:hypothetical protein
VFQKPHSEIDREDAGKQEAFGLTPCSITLLFALSYRWCFLFSFVFLSKIKKEEDRKN